ncbi:MAG: hypothetical protein AAGK37_01045 [Pseudomonadota bacterium]
MFFRLIAILAFGISTASPSNAHSPLPGIEGFYVGLLDPFRAVPQLLALGGLALLVSGFQTVRIPVLCGLFLVAALVGVVFGATLPHPSTALLFCAALAGLWASFLPGRFVPVAGALVLATGVYLGTISIPDPGPHTARVVTVSGSLVGLNVGLIYLAGGILMMKDKFAAAVFGRVSRFAGLILGCAAIIVLVQGSVPLQAPPES